VSANGGAGSNGRGCGSGGSVKIKANTMSGSGLITADGGSSTAFGAGGGGRVAIYYEDMSQFTSANIHAYGGKGNTGTTVAYNAGAGTIYLKPSGQEFGDLIIDNHNTATATTIYSTTLPAVGAGFNTAVGEDVLENNGANWPLNSLVGLRLNPNPSGVLVFSIMGNDMTHIWVCPDPELGVLTDQTQVGYPYIGEHHLFNLTVKGKARVFTFDRIKTSGLLTVEPGSALKAENVER
jgi:hypothetical protein